jgi:hypothetical protein
MDAKELVLKKFKTGSTINNLIENVYYEQKKDGIKPNRKEIRGMVESFILEDYLKNIRQKENGI